VNDTQLLERLGTAYASIAAPVPTAELVECMARGGVVDGDDESTRAAVVVPLVIRRPAARLRYSVAAAVAAVAVFSGLAVAGALPDPVQRQVSSFASHFGLDLPAPSDTHHRSSAPGNGSSTPGIGSSTPATAPVTLPVTTEPLVPPAAATATSPTTPGPTSAAAPSGSLSGTLGQIGAVGGSVATTTPPTKTSPLPEPEVTVPPPTVPQVTLPSTTLPPPTLPTLPALPLPGL
jgi:hypothetical protein